jgi:hypothetical protein
MRFIINELLHPGSACRIWRAYVVDLERKMILQSAAGHL